MCKNIETCVGLVTKGVHGVNPFKAWVKNFYDWAKIGTGYTTSGPLDTICNKPP
jgi:hypothetical protein